MSGDAEALAEVLGEIRVAGAREADWWTNDEDHALLIRVLKGECVPWAEGLLESDWLAAYVAAERDRAVAEALAPVRALARKWQHTPGHYCCERCGLDTAFRAGLSAEPEGTGA